MYEEILRNMCFFKNYISLRFFLSHIVFLNSLYVFIPVSSSTCFMKGFTFPAYWLYLSYLFFYYRCYWSNIPYYVSTSFFSSQFKRILHWFIYVHSSKNLKVLYFFRPWNFERFFPRPYFKLIFWLFHHLI